MHSRNFVALLLGVLAASLAESMQVRAAEIDTTAKSLEQIKAVGREGAGHQEATLAWKSLVNSGVDALIPTIAAMDDSKPLAANWLRLAAQAIAEKEEQAKKPLPADKLELFVKDSKHAPASRRLAYEFLVQADPKAPERLLPTMIDDSSVELRRDAIAAAVEKTMPLVKADPKKAAHDLEKLFHSSRDKDQTEKIAKSLKELNIAIDMNAHFGVLSNWMLIGPFDSTKGVGYGQVFEPELKVDLGATYKGKNKEGPELKWIEHTSTEPYGAVDFNKALGKNMDVTAYAFAALQSDSERPVEVRFGCPCAVKVFLNGKEIFAREEYHHGDRFDQYVAPGTLKAGRNEILIKVCQNNEKEPWTQDWKFQLRICDFTGGALPVTLIKNKPAQVPANAK